MIRIRKNGDSYEITVRYENTCPAEELASCIAGAKKDIEDGLDKLAPNALHFDEVVEDAKGNLHCKNSATPETPDDV